MAQDEIVLLNGKVLEGKITKQDDAYLTMQYANKRDKMKTYDIEKYRMFSFTEAGKGEKVIYYQDSLLGNFLSVEEMRYFIQGQQDADRAYNSKGAFVAGFVLGLGAVAATSGGFQNDPGIIPLTAPFVCILFYGSKKVKIKMESVSDPELLSHESYIQGYVRVARKKRIFGSVKGSIGGILGGIGAWLLISPEEDTE